MYDIVACATKKASCTPSVGFVTSKGISDTNYFSVAPFTVTGLQLDIYSNAWRFSYLKKYTVVIFKRMSKLKKEKRMVMRGHGTGVVKWLGIILQITGGRWMV
jgi:hypothetical protein